MKRLFRKYCSLQLVLFSLIFVTCLLLSHAWYDPKSPSNSTYMLVAVFILRPLALMVGTALILYIAELFGIVQIVRKRALSIVLLIFIPLFCIWVILSFSAKFPGAPNLIGDNLQVFISNVPDFIFPKQLGYAFALNIKDYPVTLISEVLGLGLFIAVGKKVSPKKSICS